MQNRSGHGVPARPAPFVGGRPSEPAVPPTSQRPRPFSPVRAVQGARELDAPTEPFAAEAESPVAGTGVDREHAAPDAHVEPIEALRDDRSAGASDVDSVDTAEPVAEAAVEPEPQQDAPTWHFARYEPGMPDDDAPPPVFDAPPPSLEVRAPSIDEDSPVVSEPVGHEVDIARAAAMLRTVADRLERGEIQLPPGSTTDSEAAVIAAVLSVLPGANQ